MQHKMSRADMEATIKRGESVLFEGRIITKVADLPSEATLAAGDEAAEESVLRDLRRQRDKLDDQIDEIMSKQRQRQQAPPVQHDAKAPEAEPKDTDKDSGETMHGKPHPAFGPRKVETTKEADKPKGK